ncbi:MAG: transcriptional regulator [Candidatus Magnetoglobus multicellularis str. Araruama]|uniref:Transcriptional regulator n=1 Tax=Candidatus Magnetoglobus multicellularis str. Araruama TaxID=890399 RepID=A0A1V1NSW7_9BACT|nr:MAG: transcriptional regulator [Candidatus Magnetoglobus multicellularis str. Araruama]
MRKIIKPTIDCVFKAIFGTEENKPLLINFLNAVLGLKKHQKIKEVHILNPYNEKEFQDDKLSIIDIKATDERGNFHQIEVQISVYRWLAERMLFNWASIYHSQLTSGQDYTQLKPTISIWLLEDTLFSPEKGAGNLEKSKYQHLNFKPYDLNVKIYLSNHFDIHILQLPFFSSDKMIRDDIDRWLYFFKEGHNIEIKDLPENLKTKEIMKAMETLNHFSNDQKAYLLYQERLEATRVASTWQSLLKQKDTEIQIKDSEIQIKDTEIQMKDSEILKLKSLVRRYEKNQIKP